MEKKKVQVVTSAGGIVFQRDQEGIRFLVLKREDGKFFLPKGLVEKGETFEEVALREVEEETGLSRSTLSIVTKLGTDSFFFYWKPDQVYYRKFVHYFLMESSGKEPPSPQREEGYVEALWLTPEDTIEHVKRFKGMTDLVRKATEILRNDAEKSGKPSSPTFRDPA